MLWNKKTPQEAKPPADPVRYFEMAKEATRRATFLTTGAKMPGGASSAREMATLFRVCRTVALTAGGAVGQSAEQVDAAIAAQCDEDVVRLKSGSDEDIREFSRESGEIVKAFLATLDEQTLMSAAQG
jgi:hypothetical protein